MDDNVGLQYHFPITSSSNNGMGPSRRKGAQLSVVHVAVEMAPIAKVGCAHGHRAGRGGGGRAVEVEPGGLRGMWYAR